MRRTPGVGWPLAVRVLIWNWGDGSRATASVKGRILGRGLPIGWNKARLSCLAQLNEAQPLKFGQRSLPRVRRTLEYRCVAVRNKSSATIFVPSEVGVLESISVLPNKRVCPIDLRLMHGVMTANSMFGTKGLGS